MSPASSSLSAAVDPTAAPAAASRFTLTFLPCTSSPFDRPSAALLVVPVPASSEAAALPPLLFVSPSHTGIETAGAAWFFVTVPASSEAAAPLSLKLEPLTGRQPGEAPPLTSVASLKAKRS